MRYERILRDVVCGWTDISRPVPCSPKWRMDLTSRSPRRRMGPGWRDLRADHELTKGPKRLMVMCISTAKPQKKFPAHSKAVSARVLHKITVSRDSRSRAFTATGYHYGGGAVKPDCRKGTSASADQRDLTWRSRTA